MHWVAYPISGSTVDKLKLQASHFPPLSLRHSEIKSHLRNPVPMGGAQRGFRDFKGHGATSFLKAGARYMGIYYIVNLYNLYTYLINILLSLYNSD